MNMLSIILDVVVLIGLGITIYYCVNLTKSLNTFRSARQEFGSLMRELSGNIDEAYRAVDNLKVVSRDAGQSLQKTINESRMIARELEVLNQSLSELAPGLDVDEPDAADEDEFSIFDRESRESEEEEPRDFSSQAERDLYEAIQNNRKAPRRGSIA